MTTLTLNQETIFKCLGVLFLAMLFTKLIEQRGLPSREVILGMIFIPLMLDASQLLLILSAFFNVTRSYYLGTFIVQLFDSVFRIQVDKKILMSIFFALYLIKIFI